MSVHARKRVVADGQVVGRVCKIKSITFCTADTGSAILYNGTSAGDPEVYRFLQSTGVHDNLNITCKGGIFADITGTVDFQIIYE